MVIATVSLCVIGAALYVFLFLRSHTFRRLAKWLAWVPAMVVGMSVGIANWPDSRALAVWFGAFTTLLIWGGLYWQFGRIKPILQFVDRLAERYSSHPRSPKLDRLEGLYRRAAKRVRQSLR
jgi:uncharacterized membrane protein YfcA